VGPFEYLQTFRAIILGLGIADMLQSLHRLLVGGAVVEMALGPFALGDRRVFDDACRLAPQLRPGGERRSRSVPPRVVPRLLFLISSAALPDVEKPLEEEHPLREHFEVRWRCMAVLWSAFFASGLASMVVLKGWGSDKASFMAAGLMVSLPAVLTRNLWYQTAVPILLIVNALLLMFR
jgi:hypothetical protein